MSRIIKMSIIHCSATKNGQRVTAEEIDQWHAHRGFKRAHMPEKCASPWLLHIGYHRIIHADGTVQIGREIEEIGAHALGYNAESIGTCLVGGIGDGDEREIGRYTLAQWRSLQACILEDMRNFKLTKNDIYGHRDLSPDKDGDGKIERQEWLKTCPGFDVKKWVQNFSISQQHILVG